MSSRVLRACVLAGALVAAMPSAALAQGEGRFEVSGSISYLYPDVEGSGVIHARGIGFHGGFVVPVNDWLGLGGEIGYNHNVGRLDLGFRDPFFPFVALPKLNHPQWTALFGPRFRIIEGARVRFGAQAMAGIAHGSAEFQFKGDELVVEIPGMGVEKFTPGEFHFDFGTAPAALLGVHVDLRVTDRVVWRVAEPDVLITAYRDGVQAHFRISSGFGVEF